MLCFLFFRALEAACRFASVYGWIPGLDCFGGGALDGSEGAARSTVLTFYRKRSRVYRVTSRRPFCIPVCGLWPEPCRAMWYSILARKGALIPLLTVGVDGMFLSFLSSTREIPGPNFCSRHHEGKRKQFFARPCVCRGSRHAPEKGGSNCTVA